MSWKRGKNWTKKETEYLEEHWGRASIPTIARKLNRSITAINVKAQRLQLGPVLESGGYITFNQLLKAVCGTDYNSGSYKKISWIKKRGFPVKEKKVRKNSFLVVYLDDFWEWAEKNKSFLDFSKMEPNILGEEPEWLKEQRRKDFKNPSYRKTPWTAAEDERLKYLLKQQKYTYNQISEMINRNEGAIQRRCYDLGIKDRPVKTDNVKWNDSEFEILTKGIRSGDSYTEIGRQLGRTERSVRGRVYKIYGTEVADKVRDMLKERA